MPLQVRMTSHYGILRGEEADRAKLALSLYTIPKVKSNQEGEARAKRMSKIYLPKQEPKKMTQTEKLAQKKGVQIGKLIHGSKEKNIPRMSQKVSLFSLFFFVFLF